jgi:hypothetical protein
MRPLPLALALALALAATAAAAGELPRAAAEGEASYTCRVQLTPASRACLARCESSYRAEAQEGERWGCVQDCTGEHLRAMRDCRDEAVAAARVSAPHAASDDDRPVAFDPARLTD